MGTLTYESHLSIALEDRTLLHLQMVIGAKLRRHESFYFTWRTRYDDKVHQTTVWLHDAVSLAFDYPDAAPMPINRTWVEAFMVTANSASGLYLVDEPAEAELAAPTTRH